MDNITIHAVNPISQENLTNFREVLRNGPVLITTHDNPDPDALASGKAINHLINTIWGIPTKLYYGGIVGRAENRAMLKLVTTEWKQISELVDLSKFSAIVFVDCQPGSRNNMFTEQITLPMVVIDHHSISKQSQPIQYADIRSDVGSTVTMVYQYLHVSQADIDPILATAMFYGLQSDSNGLSRGSTFVDGLVYVKLLEILDRQLLLKIETAGLVQEYYQAFYQGMQNTKIYGRTIITHLGNMHRPDLAAEMADLLFRYESVDIALCSGVYKQEIQFSIRTGSINQDAGILVQNVIFPPGKAGGHGVMAGGQIPLREEDTHATVSKLETRFLESLGLSHKSRPLLKKK